MVPALRHKRGPMLIGMILVTILVGVAFTQSNRPQVKADWTYPSGYDPQLWPPKNRVPE
ncbi:MAG: hypothetical protein ACFE9D_07480 [Promethearchaeota archaeon]